ncbi:MAG: hypothetical protein MMC33_009828 [Icmadophila ericetorum]|nr:hypothetical protein [Icmadophila ericetorum]
MNVPVASNNAVHLARALLRECTYLPDLAARTYFRSYVVHRFREYWPRKNPNGPWSHTKEVPTGSRQVKVFRQARKGLGQLQRANQGYIDCLLKVLLHTYGRSGKRRHELMKAARLPENLEDHVAVARAAAESRDIDATKNYLLPTKLLVLAKAHKRVQLPNKRQIKSTSPKIPEKNIWGRPMPVKRVRNMKKRWFADTLEQMQPPLHLQEWQRLQDLASGRTKWPGPVARRGPRPVPVLDTPKRMKPHNITARLMRRLWTTVYTQCPVMLWDKEKSVHRVQWGGRTDLRPPVGHVNRTGDIFFHGVDERGRLEGAMRITKHGVASREVIHLSRNDS